jgi:hypoxanthine-DNA glycosylase
MEQGLAPVYDQQTEILILGSAPSQISLKIQEYYGNKGNQFWKTVFQALDVPDPVNYQERLQLLKVNKIGIWDVYHSFERKGSMDHHFSSSTLNNFQEILTQAPIKKIIANGKKAFEEIQQNQLFETLEVIPCLSTSGANNARMKERQLQWNAALISKRHDNHDK